jgi:hypothetical protein
MLRRLVREIPFLIVMWEFNALAQTNLIPSFLKFEAYTNITGNAVQNLLSHPSYPNSPGEVLYLTAFDSRTVYTNDSHEAFGARISGFITPAEAGDYQFFLRSEGASQLFLSTDDKASGLQVIAEETACCGAFEEPGAPETSVPIPLQAGRRYAIQALYKAGPGGDYCQVAWRKVGDTTPPSDLRPIPGAFLSSMIAAKGTIAIAKQPVNSSAAQNDLATFNIEVTSSQGPAVIQWQTNGLSIPGRTGSTLTLGPLMSSDNNTKVRALISIPGAVTNSAEVTLTVTADTTLPTIRSVVGSDTFDRLIVEFSEAVTAASANAATNYSLNGLMVAGATVLSPNTVKLATSKQTLGAPYTLTIKNIIDTAGNTNAPDTKLNFSAFAAVRGKLKLEAYYAIEGTNVQELLDNPKFPGSPDLSGFVTAFTSRLVSPDNPVGLAARENYGGRLSGWIVPADTAQYEFFIRSDDASQLFLSPDENPANATPIAGETGCCGPFEESGFPETSAAISLVAGKRYFIQALWKVGDGVGYCDVAWRKVGDTSEARSLAHIPGTLLETLATPETFTPPDVAALKITLEAINKVVISWTGTATLQSANDVTGSWTDVANATTPFIVTPSEAKKFYRLKP